MALAIRSRLGPYEVLAPLGAGGMGEVYRARDSRLGREVAVKILPPSLAGDPDRLQRFEREARAASLLNHPNILTVFDVGRDGNTPYVVSELLEGETLRARLEAGPLPVRKAVEYSIAIANGTAAAHEKGIVHRDLKPENVFVTRDGRVKVLDFGLAKLLDGFRGQDAPESPTVAADTQAGMVLGTVGYMAPEQVQGQRADARSDIFSLGAMLYEMVAGRPPFKRSSAIETMNAILKEDPPSIEESAIGLPPGLGAVVHHCLEKNPEERFQSARDLAFDLQALSTASGRVVPPVLRARTRRRVLRTAFLILLGLVAAGVAFFAGRRSVSPVHASFQQLTFREGIVAEARFGVDGRSFIYSGRWGDAPEQVLVAQAGDAESRPLDLPPARVLAVSNRGELALMLRPQFHGPFRDAGTLARVGGGGGAPRELVENVEAADWSPDGDRVAIVRDAGGRRRLEYPVGTVLFDTAGWMGNARVAPDGKAVAFILHADALNDAGDVMLVDDQKHVQVLAAGWLSAGGLAWSGDEVWFTASPRGNVRQLYGVRVGSSPRLLAATTGSVTLLDATPGGRVLVRRDSFRTGIAMRVAGVPEERDLSWLDWSLVRALTPDGRTIAFDETGEGGGPRHGIYLRRTDGSGAVRLGDGSAPSLSHDGHWVASVHDDRRDEIFVVPTGPGEAFTVKVPGLSVFGADWLPGDRRLLVNAYEPGRGPRVYVQAIDQQSRTAVTPENVSHPIGSLDGRFVIANLPDGSCWRFPLDGGQALRITGLDPRERPIRTTPDGKGLYVFSREVTPIAITLIDLATGRRTPAASIAGHKGPMPAMAIQMTPDLRTIVYSYTVASSDLYLGEHIQ